MMPFGFVANLNINEGCSTYNLVQIFLVSELCNQHGRTLETGDFKNWQRLIIYLSLVGVWVFCCMYNPCRNDL